MNINFPEILKWYKLLAKCKSQMKKWEYKSNFSYLYQTLEFEISSGLIALFTIMYPSLIINLLYCLSYPWAVYCEGPPSFIWGEGERGAKKWGTVIPVYSWHTLSKHAQNIIPVYSWHTLSKRVQNTKKLRRLALSAFINTNLLIM